MKIIAKCNVKNEEEMLKALTSDMSLKDLGVDVKLKLKGFVKRSDDAGGNVLMTISTDKGYYTTQSENVMKTMETIAATYGDTSDAVFEKGINAVLGTGKSKNGRDFLRLTLV